MKAFAKDIELKAAEQYKAAKAEYDAGNYATALAQYEEIAKLQGLAAAESQVRVARTTDRMARSPCSVVQAHQFTPVRRSSRTRSGTQPPCSALITTPRPRRHSKDSRKSHSRKSPAAEKDIETTLWRRLRQAPGHLPTNPDPICSSKGPSGTKESSRIDGMQQAAKDYEEARQAESVHEKLKPQQRRRPEKTT